jgi:hypothetical protein
MGFGCVELGYGAEFFDADTADGEFFTGNPGKKIKTVTAKHSCPIWDFD